MDVKRIDQDLSVTGQLRPTDVSEAARLGFRSIICNRPDGEGADQPGFAEIERAATEAGLDTRYLPVVSGAVTDADAEAFGVTLRALPGPVLAYCGTGTRSTTLWFLNEGRRGRPLSAILATAKAAGYDMNGVVQRIASGGCVPTDGAEASHTVVIVGGGAGGIAVAASLRSRKPDLDIAIIEPADVHYYQPGWTMVGGGVFEPATTARTMASLIPDGVRWIKAAVAAFEPERKAVILEGCRVVTYDRLIVASGLTLNWGGIEGLSETLGRNGVARRQMIWDIQRCSGAEALVHLG